MVNSIRIWLIKRKLKKHYIAYCNLLDNYNCGKNMIDQITGGKLGHHKNMFNILMDQLSCIDKKTPETRL